MRGSLGSTSALGCPDMPDSYCIFTYHCLMPAGHQQLALLRVYLPMGGRVRHVICLCRDVCDTPCELCLLRCSSCDSVQLLCKLLKLPCNVCPCQSENSQLFSCCASAVCLQVPHSCMSVSLLGSSHTGSQLLQINRSRQDS